jgi:hypothetical protein
MDSGALPLCLAPEILSQGLQILLTHLQAAQVHVISPMTLVSNYTRMNLDRYGLQYQIPFVFPTVMRGRRQVNKRALTEVRARRRIRGGSNGLAHQTQGGF